MKKSVCAGMRVRGCAGFCKCVCMCGCVGQRERERKRERESKMPKIKYFLMVEGRLTQG